MIEASLSSRALKLSPTFSAQSRYSHRLVVHDALTALEHASVRTTFLKGVSLYAIPTISPTDI
jgi:hypothetical protein